MCASLINVQNPATWFKLEKICLGVPEKNYETDLVEQKYFKWKCFKFGGTCVFEQFVFLTLKHVLALKYNKVFQQ